MREFNYQGLAFRQQEASPIQVSFVAHAEEIMEWAGIPRKSDEFLAGFQRFRDDQRVDQEILPFFQDPKNCSPTAIIVALRKESGIGGARLSAVPMQPGQILAAQITITLDDQKLASDDIFEAASSYVNSRLRREPAPSETMAREEDEDLDDEEDDEADTGEFVSGNENIHLGSATLARLKQLLDDRSNWTNRNFRNAIVDFVKPAFLIDGQHRVAAAAKIGPKGLPFIVCGLYDPAWEEQVFQFTVVNLKPRKISPALITSIAALSLTKTEQSELEGRLQQAGVRMAEVTIMSLVAHDDQSPFAGLVNLAVGDPGSSSDLLGYGAMKRIAKVWYRAHRTSLTNIALQLFSTTSISQARSKWQADRAWFDFFCTFWRTIKEHYSADLWKKSEGNHLFVGATLYAFQEALLGGADGQLRSIWALPDEMAPDQRSRESQKQFRSVIEAHLSYFPEEMWTIRWAKSGQDTSAGRNELVKLFDIFMDHGKKTGKVWKLWKKSDWFKV